MTNPRILLYPEEIARSGAQAVLALVQDLGFSALSVAMTYHRARRVMPRLGAVSTLLGGGLAFEPSTDYGRVKPLGDSDSGCHEALMELRTACLESQVEFGAWLVPLSNDELVWTHPDLRAQTCDGGFLGSSLCPSWPEASSYVGHLVRDVGAQFHPDFFELEGLLYPGWEPSFSMTLGEPTSWTTLERALVSQCFCQACRTLGDHLGIDLKKLQPAACEMVFGTTDPSIVERLRPDLTRLREVGVTRVLEQAKSAVAAHGSKLHVMGFGLPQWLAWQGFTRTGIELSDAVAFGCGRLTGQELMERFQSVSNCLADHPVGVILNWFEGRDIDATRRDIHRLAELGAASFGTYNLSLSPESAFEFFRMFTDTVLEASPNDH